MSHATLDILFGVEVGFVLKWRDPRVAKRIVREHQLRWQRHTKDVRVADGPLYQGVRSVICGVKGELTMLLINLDRAAKDLFDFYNQRRTIEAFFKASKHVFGMANLRSRRILAIAVFLGFVLRTYNLLVWTKAALFAGTKLVTAHTRQMVEKIISVPAFRMILGVGLGNPIENEYARFGEPTDPKVLAGMLDEGLEAITLLWSGEPVTFRSRYFTVDDVLMRPPPVQHPRVPIWVGGEWPNKGPARRAARWDGSVMNAGNAWGQPPDVAVIAEMHAFFRTRRVEAGRESAAFDLVVGGSTAGMGVKARDILGPLADAGATWWDERFPIDRLDKFDVARARIEEGPPRID